MPAELLQIAGSLGGFAGLAYVLHIFTVGREVKFLRDAIERQTKKDLLMLVASNHVHPEVKEAAAVLIEEIKTSEIKRK